MYPLGICIEHFDSSCIVHDREMAGSVAIDYNKKDCDTTDGET
jgi:hypothetical protein